MDAFSFVFSLFSIVLGLALAEVFGGFGRALQSRRKIHIGWMSPLLGAIVAFDITSFWALSWQVHDRIPAKIFVLFCSLVIAGIYYLVAKLTFPDDPAEWPDYDDYYFAHKRIVVGGGILCNVLAQLAQTALGLQLFRGALNVAEDFVFYVPIVILFFVRSSARTSSCSRSTWRCTRSSRSSSSSLKEALRARSV